MNCEVSIFIYHKKLHATSFEKHEEQSELLTKRNKWKNNLSAYILNTDEIVILNTGPRISIFKTLNKYVECMVIDVYLYRC